MLNFKTSVLYLLGFLMLQGCGPKTFQVKNSELDVEPYVSTEPSSATPNISFVDQNTSDNKIFSFGRLKVNLELDGQPVDPVDYLRHNVIKELNNKGIEVNSDVESEVALYIEQFYLRNHRTNGYTPFITFGNFKGNLDYAGQTHAISAFVKRGKVPVWSFNEVIEPTLNEPLALVSKEVAAKINRVIFGRMISDTQVDKLVASIQENDEDKKSFLKVYELGFGNNSKAIDSLVEFTKYDEEYIRLAAISSLGILQAENQVAYLWSIFESDSIWQDRAMAIKALGDINTVESKKKLEQARSMITSEKQRSIDWFTEIFNLYD